MRESDSMDEMERQWEQESGRPAMSCVRCLPEQGCVPGLDAPLVGQRRPKATVHMHGFYQVLHTTGGTAEALNPGVHLYPPTKLTRFG